MGEGIVGSVAKSGIPELIHDTSKDSRYIKDIEYKFRNNSSNCCRGT